MVFRFACESEQRSRQTQLGSPQSRPGGASTLQSYLAEFFLEAWFSIFSFFSVSLSLGGPQDTIVNVSPFGK